MVLTQRDLETFKLLSRYRYLRRTFIHALLSTPINHEFRKRIGSLRAHGFLREPPRQKESMNYRYCPRVYELAQKGREAIGSIDTPVKANQFWHQLMICDILASIEVSCMHKGLSFQILEKPSELKTPFGAVRPDAYFSISGTHFCLEADRGTESNAKRWDEKIEKYISVFENKTYLTEWGVPSLIVLNMFTSTTKAENVRAHIESKLNRKSRSLWFAGRKSLGSRDKAPLPLVTITDDLWNRAGHEAVSIISALN